MSNLSDLIPAGASGKTIEATATATITSKAPVILNSAGTVSPISESTSTETIPAGSAASYTAVSGSPASNYRDNMVRMSWDGGDTDKFVIVSDENYDQKLHARVGTVTNSGGSTSISFGTPLVVFSGACCNDQIEADPNSTGKWLVQYNDRGTPANDYCVIVSASGATGLTLGTPVDRGGNASASQEPGRQHTIAWDPNVANQAVIVWMTSDSPALAYAQVVTVSGTTVTFGTAVSFGGSANIYYPTISADKESGKFLVSYRDDGNSSYGTANTITLTGTSIAFGTPAVYQSASVGGTADIACDPDTAGKAIVFFGGYGPVSGYTDRNAQVRVCTRDSSDALTFGAVSIVGATAATGVAVTAVRALGGGSGKFVLGFLPTNNSYASDLILDEATYSGTSITLGGNSSDLTGGTEMYSQGGLGISADENTAGRVVTGWSQGTASNPKYTRAICADIAVTTSNLTSTNFVGIADAGIATSATGTIVVQGGTVSDYPEIPASNSAGTPVVFETAAADKMVATFDSNENKVVIAYQDVGNSDYGTAVVGDVSGTSVSYGTPVVFESAECSQIAITFDSNENKAVIFYKDHGNSNYGTAIVATVSGTSISYGSAVVFESASSSNMSAAFDSSNNKVVTAYSTTTMKSIVGTVSSTSISFGTAVQFDAASTVARTAVVFDSSANKVAIGWQDSGNLSYGTAIVGTVSGTSISFGTEVVFEAADIYYPAGAFDSDSNKVVFA